METQSSTKKELKKETALFQLTENIGRKVKATTINSEEETRAEANKQKQALRKKTGKGINVLAQIAIC